MQLHYLMIPRIAHLERRFVTVTEIASATLIMTACAMRMKFMAAPLEVHAILTRKRPKQTDPATTLIKDITAQAIV
jgi:hypothetical protein